MFLAVASLHYVNNIQNLQDLFNGKIRKSEPNEKSVMEFISEFIEWLTMTISAVIIYAVTMLAMFLMFFVITMPFIKFSEWKEERRNKGIPIDPFTGEER